MLGYSERLGRNLRSGPPRAEREKCPVFEYLPMTDGHGFALLRLFLRGVRYDDAVVRGFLFLNPRHYNAVV
jgi:hypothetical protein